VIAAVPVHRWQYAGTGHLTDAIGLYPLGFGARCQAARSIVEKAD
jgi:hypothetical protein